MKQAIVSTRKEAIKFAEAANGNSQRSSYWKENNKAYRAECIPGETACTIRENCGGLWWSATKTIAQKLGL